MESGAEDRALGTNVHVWDYGHKKRVRAEKKNIIETRKTGVIMLAAAYKQRRSENVYSIRMFYLHTVCGAYLLNSHMKLHTADLVNIV